MNSFSWFLYWIDVVASISVILTAASVLFLIALIALWIACAFRIEAGSREEKDKTRQIRAAWTWRFAIMAGAMSFVASFMPSKGTMYAIAASQVGEQVVHSEEIRGMASDAQKALQRWIKKQIEPENKK